MADHARLLPRTPPTGREAGRIRFPARHSPESWPGTCQTRDAVWDRLTRAPFVVDNAHTQKIRLRGLTFLLDWLEDQPGRTWQERWLASGADAAGAGWRKSPARWLQEHDLVADWRLDALASALLVAISADLVRPALGWLVAKATGPGSLVRHLAHARDPDGFARLKALCNADPHVSSVANSHTLHRAAEILATKGGVLADVTVGDVLALFLPPFTGSVALFQHLRDKGRIDLELGNQIGAQEDLEDVGVRVGADVHEEYADQTLAAVLDYVGDRGCPVRALNLPLHFFKDRRFLELAANDVCGNGHENRREEDQAPTIGFEGLPGHHLHQDPTTAPRAVPAAAPTNTSEAYRSAGALGSRLGNQHDAAGLLCAGTEALQEAAGDE